MNLKKERSTTKRNDHPSGRASTIHTQKHQPNPGKRKTHVLSNMILKTSKTIPKWNQHHPKMDPK
jgi:hypothetical protein